MKRLLMALSVAGMMLWSLTAAAQTIAVVDMAKIFQTSSQVKKINSDLEKQFSSQRNKIMGMGKDLQTEITKLQKNEAVMDKKSADELKQKITEQENQFRTAQVAYQKSLFDAQNQAMTGFMKKVSDVVSSIAKDKKLDAVLPKNALIYSQSNMDITSDVLSKLN